jgi:uncharacterized protein (TIGR03118 family)
MSTSKKCIYGGLLATALLLAPAFAATNFVRTDLLADSAGTAAVCGACVDPNLVGTWGISVSAGSPFWVSNTANGTSTVYTVSDATPATLTAPVISSTVVAVPPSANNKGSKTGLPTGQVVNGYGVGNLDVVPASGSTAAVGSNFIFATLDGTIAARMGATSVIMVDNGAKGAVYTGLALGSRTANAPYDAILYAANFSQGTIDTFDKNWKPITLSGGFQDPNLPGGYYPSNIQRYGRRLYVTYNFSDGAGSFAYGGPGTGLINVYDLNGNLVERLVPNNEHLNLPWGVAVTGANFGSFSYALVVGNFGDGTISAFDLHTGNYLGTMQDGKGNNISISGLWGLQWGNGGSGGSASTLYFAASPGAGPSGYSQHGLFGSLKPGPDGPSTLQ